jgi:hypothetical protein
VLWSLAYLVVRCLFELMVLCCRSQGSRELEILVLRHERSILIRQARRPQLQEADLVFLAALSRASTPPTTTDTGRTAHSRSNLPTNSERRPSPSRHGESTARITRRSRQRIQSGRMTTAHAMTEFSNPTR